MIIDFTSDPSTTIAVVGAGYVGLPLALELAEHFSLILYDIDEKRISELQNGYDRNFEFAKEKIKKCKNLKFTYSIKDLEAAKCFIVTVPTPINKDLKPELSPILAATTSVAQIIKKGDFVVYESTVYPGLTEEICIPLIERIANIKVNHDFFVGYSPERINPSDKRNTIRTITKVVSGSSTAASKIIQNLYEKIVDAGTFRASAIKVAEAAKVFENIQRDVNIALVNEFAVLCDSLDIDVHDVLKAARTKWNFIDFRPGLVGGHCISVDPYYLIDKAKQIGSPIRLVEQARVINETFPNHIKDKVLINIPRRDAIRHILLMGFTFKENCTDIRNTKVARVREALIKEKFEVDVYDPFADNGEVRTQYGFDLVENIERSDYDAVLYLVDHDIFSDEARYNHKNFLAPDGYVYKLKP